MTNTGVLSGLTRNSWKTKQSELATVNTSPTGSGLTQPFLDTGGFTTYQSTRYAAQGNVAIVEMQITFAFASTTGTGTAYAFKLPIPARRLVPDTPSVMPIGTLMCYSILSPLFNFPCAVTLADPWASLNGQHDNYCQAFVPYSVSAGTVSGWNPSTPQVVNHVLGYTPSAYDISVQSDAYGAANSTHPWYVDTIGSTSFTVHTWSNNGMGGTPIGHFGWKVQAEPPTGQGGNLVGPTTPFSWATLGAFGSMFARLVYEIA